MDVSAWRNGFTKLTGIRSTFPTVSVRSSLRLTRLLPGSSKSRAKSLDMSHFIDAAPILSWRWPRMPWVSHAIESASSLDYSLIPSYAERVSDVFSSTRQLKMLSPGTFGRFWTL
jgi:hypothetical protein